MQTSHFSSRCRTYGGHGSEPQPPSTKYSKTPSLFPLVPGTYSGSFVSTDEVFLVPVVVIWGHQVPMILLGPSRWTVIPCGHHQHWATWLDKADNARRLVIMKISSERIATVGADPTFSTRTHILSTDRHRYTCRTLDCVEDKGSLLHSLGDCNIHLPLNLRMKTYKLKKVHYSAMKCSHNKFHFLSNWQHNRAKYRYDKLDLLHSNCSAYKSLR